MGWYVIEIYKSINHVPSNFKRSQPHYDESKLQIRQFLFYAVYNIVQYNLKLAQRPDSAN